MVLNPQLAKPRPFAEESNSMTFLTWTQFSLIWFEILCIS